MIKSFKNKGLKSFFFDGDMKKINPNHAKKLGLVLDLLNGAHSYTDMNFPGSNFHSLQGKMENFYSVKINENWRVIFKFSNGDAYEVDYVDYH